MKRRGTTLLETLLALAITALVLAALTGFGARTRAARIHATAAAERVALARTVLLRLTAELESARPAGARVTTALDTGWSTLELTTTTRDAQPLPANDAHRIDYRVDASEGSAVLVRRESTRPQTTDPPEDPLLDHIERFRVRCFDGQTWSETWAGGPLPAAVEVQLAFGDGRGGREELTTAVALPAAERR